ncbi:hypothetical protein [Candidatus Sulfurimonas baltica]|uniref:DUF4878 domain-containing protein n=1 Tax=Candidatus Sulfurimonas baltica TaxID=2740404 RepID=A0A7S7RMA5_9BACT|nr:hypothetical protein [Candidatus Sulfurimonas baltica]QOY51296.1 hypothetical protein HUE88_09170 [Candidatus Sulfurimonas baltica]
MNLLKISLVLPGLLFIGCSSPKDAVSNMYDALKEGDMAKVSRNANDNASIFFLSRALDTCSVDKKSYTDDIKLANVCLKEKYQDLKYKNIKIEKLTEKNTYADVEVTNNNKTSSVTLLVQNIDGKWMVLGFKEPTKTFDP